MIYRCNDAEYAVTLEKLADGAIRATIGDRVYTLTAAAIDGGWLLSLDGQQTRVYAAAHGSERFVNLNGETFTLALAETHQRRGGRSGGGDLTAQMPGQVREVLIQAGDPVERGQVLLLLEAMKMEIRVTAPNAGRVKRLLVKPGEVVDRGQRLVEME